MNKTTSASASIAPDSRKSDKCGARSSLSGARVSWLSARTGTAKFLAKAFKPRLMSANFFLAAAQMPRAGYQLQIIHDHEAQAMLVFDAFRARHDFADRSERRIVDP